MLNNCAGVNVIEYMQHAATVWLACEKIVSQRGVPKIHLFHGHCACHTDAIFRIRPFCTRGVDHLLQPHDKSGGIHVYYPAQPKARLLPEALPALAAYYMGDCQSRLHHNKVCLPLRSGAMCLWQQRQRAGGALFH